MKIISQTKIFSMDLNEKIDIAKIEHFAQSVHPHKSIKPDTNKINKALSSFWKNFDEDDIPKINKELEDLIKVAMFTHRERELFLSKIVKKLSEKGITLDSLNFV